MIKSMTGYGRGQVLCEGKDVLVEIKSVNHRYLDCSCRVPRTFGYLEEKLKSAVASNISRGKVEVYVSINLAQSDAVSVTLNRNLLSSYLSVFEEMKNEYGICDDISVLGLCRIPDICVMEKKELDADEIWQIVKSAFDLACEDFLQMRRSEGEALYRNLKSKAEEIMALVEQIEARVPVINEQYAVRLKTNIEKILDGVEVDESRLLTEVAIFADKGAIDEEIVRMKSHIAQFEDLIAADDPVGRKIDFLVQEMNREANTMGSKSSDLEAIKIVVEMKSGIEKIREQIQNIE